MAADFSTCAAEWTAKDGTVYALDNRLEATTVLGFRPNELVITASDGLATVIGVDGDGRLLVELCSTSRAVLYPFTTRDAYKDKGFCAIHTDAEKAFVAVAVEWTVKNGNVFVLDTRPEATRFRPNGRVITIADGMATIVGVNINGYVVLEKISNGDVMAFPLWEEPEVHDFYVIRTKEDEKFVAVAVEWRAKNGDFYVVDSRPEATLPLGFYPNERINTTCGLATVIGVDINGRLVAEVINKYSAPVSFPRATKDELRASGFCPIRTDAEKAFVERATEWHARDGDIYTIDTHPDQKKGPLAYQVGEQVITSCLGLATFVGVCMNGTLLFERANNPRPLRIPNTSAEEFESAGYRAIRTDRDKKFAAVAVDWNGKNGIVCVLDTRRQALLPLGLIPNEQVITPAGLATVVGVDINGDVFCDPIREYSKPYRSDARSKDELQRSGVLTVRTDARKTFVSVAVAYHTDAHDEILLDIRPETLARHGFTDPNERFFHPLSAYPRALFKVAGVDVHGNISVRGVGDASKAVVLRLFHQSRSELLARGWQSRSKATAAPTRIKAVAPPVSRTIPAPVRTVTLSSGAVYTGAHTRAGQRHGNGTMRGADRSWRYKGQWQQGRPHGSGTLWMTIQSGRGSLMEAVYKGRWVLGVPHGRGTLCVDGVGEKRRYRGRWSHGWRAMTAAEFAAVRLSGGTVLVRHRPLPAVPTKIDASNKNVGTTTKKKAAPAAPARPPHPAAVVFAKHDEVQRMVAAVAVACSQCDVFIQESTRATSSTTKSYPISSPPETKKIPREARIRALRQFLRL